MKDRVYIDWNDNLYYCERVDEITWLIFYSIFGKLLVERIRLKNISLDDFAVEHEWQRIE